MPIIRLLLYTILIPLTAKRGRDFLFPATNEICLLLFNVGRENNFKNKKL